MLPNYQNSVELMSQEFKNYPWDNKFAYAEFLAQTYYYVCHSTKLLFAAAVRFSPEDQSLYNRFIEHSGEENAHELLALGDLKKLGFDIKDFPELPQTRTMYEIQYHKIEHRDPVALMGYILALETMAANEIQDTRTKLLETYGRNCINFIRVHADEDPDHIEKAIEVVEGLRKSRLSVIDENLEQTAFCYSEMLKAAKLRAAQKERELQKAA